MNVVLHFPRGHRATAITTLVAAFADDPAVRWLYPGEADYRAGFPALVHLHARAASAAGFVDDCCGLGAALWYRSDAVPDPRAVADCLAATVPAARREAALAWHGQRVALRPLAVHWCLAWIGVRPEARGCGIGARLVGDGLSRADAMGLPAYIEAASRRAAGLCAGHGFLPIATVGDAGSPEVTGMWRSGRCEPFST